MKKLLISFLLFSACAQQNTSTPVTPKPACEGSKLVGVWRYSDSILTINGDCSYTNTLLYTDTYFYGTIKDLNNGLYSGKVEINAGRDNINVCDYKVSNTLTLNNCFRK